MLVFAVLVETSRLLCSVLTGYYWYQRFIIYLGFFSLGSGYQKKKNLLRVRVGSALQFLAQNRLFYRFNKYKQQPSVCVYI